MPSFHIKREKVLDYQTLKRRQVYVEEEIARLEQDRLCDPYKLNSIAIQLRELRYTLEGVKAALSEIIN